MFTGIKNETSMAINKENQNENLDTHVGPACVIRTAVFFPTSLIQLNKYIPQMTHTKVLTPEN